MLPNAMHPKLQPFITSVQAHPDQFHPHNPRSASSSHADKSTRLDVGVTFLGEVRFVCNVVFDTADLSFPPDLIIPDLPSVSLSSLPALANWDPANPNALYTTLLEIRKVYQERQRAKIKALGVERLQFDLSSLEHDENLECVVESNTSSARDAKVSFRFSMPLRIDMPVTNPEEKAQQEQLVSISSSPSPPLPSPTPAPHVTITIKFHVSASDVKRIEKRLDLPPDYKDVYIPPLPDYPLHHTMLDYVMELDQYLQDVGRRLGLQEESRKEFLEYMVAAFRGQVMEYDDEEYEYAAFYFEVPAPVKRSFENLTSAARQPKMLGALVNLHLSQDYPEIPPEIFLQSPTSFTSLDSHIPETIHLNLDWGKAGVANVSHQAAAMKIRTALMSQIPTAFPEFR
ncbi:hypothetical protein PhCBS80983_g01176 [Powellomyces hirtus]|uniref:BRISC and BRCA1-A complex member 2 n=1 Tax=Powellomyces hirtus TaxID=109895 RepID=A0A507EC38_9FUNG|nr:hypothetical protein PhCBS80983_g01176 [Powellomyces hirtus]